MRNQNRSASILLTSMLTLLLGAGCMPIQPTSNLNATPISIDPVVILVVDDFSKDKPAETPPDATLCVATPDGQGRYKFRGVATDQGEFPHGNLVYAEISNLLSTMIPDNLAPVPAKSMVTMTGTTFLNLEWVKDVELWEVANRHLLVVAVDTPDWDPGIVADHISTTIKMLDIPGVEIGDYRLNEVKGYVLNLSFALVPCKLPPDPLIEAQFDNYRDLIDAYRNDVKFGRSEWENMIAKSSTDYEEAVSPDATVDIFKGFKCNLVRTSIGTKRLCELLEATQLMTPKVVISVASAGNARLPFPFAPGLFPNVITVSAAEDLEGEHIYSNRGEIKMSGIHPTLLTVQGDELTGTSFAAPRFSLMAALFLLHDNTCSADEGWNALSYDDWGDLELSDALRVHCPQFVNN